MLRFRIATSFLKFTEPGHFANAVNKITLQLINRAFKVSLLFSRSGVSDFSTPWTATCQASLFFTTSQSLLKFLSTELVMLSKLCPTLSPHGLWTAALCLWDFPNRNTGVGCHFLLQGIFLTQGSNQGLLCYRQILHQLSHQRKPKRTFIMSIKCYICSPFGVSLCIII